ncbi:MAG: hypothetical protein IPJ81_01895 [Chitinophagaceae bacterium]|nr:hypothetical protein [Chitinophagaceae bacterium]
MKFLEKLGSLMAIFGVLAIIMDFANYVPRILFWIYNWGDTVAWGIKIGLIVVGGILYLISTRSNNRV